MDKSEALKLTHEVIEYANKYLKDRQHWCDETKVDPGFWYRIGCSSNHDVKEFLVSDIAVFFDNLHKEQSYYKVSYTINFKKPEVRCKIIDLENQ